MRPGPGNIVFELKNLDNLLKKNMEAHMRALEGPEEEQLTRMHHWIIGFLFDHADENIYQRDIETEFKISRSTTSNMLSLMEKKGLIRRLNVEDDARLKRLELTETARRIHMKHMDEVHKMDDYIEGSITPAEKAELLRIVEKLSRAIDVSLSEISGQNAD